MRPGPTTIRWIRTRQQCQRQLVRPGQPTSVPGTRR